MSTPGASSGSIQPPGSGRVEKPWGYELRWALTDRYCGKVIHIDSGKSLSLQYHVQKDEWIRVESGVLELQLEDDDGAMETHRMTPGMSAHVRAGRRHRFVALEDTDLTEVSSPEIDDVVRLEDSYGRAGTSAD
ncbi:MAG TPA: cupin domain-containing protein [Candidatus Dormibacteraeota bacterium]